MELLFDDIYIKNAIHSTRILLNSAHGPFRMPKYKYSVSLSESAAQKSYSHWKKPSYFSFRDEGIAGARYFCKYLFP
jgi:hypothetical protein